MHAPVESEKNLAEDSNLDADTDETTLIPMTPLPYSKLVPAFFIQLSEGFAVQSVFAYAVFMVEDMPDVPRDQIGFYAGLLAAIFGFSQFCSAMMWGLLSDRLGTKPVLLIGCGSTVVVSILFGFSSNIVQALIFRALAGLLNGNIGSIKAYVGEITDATNQAQAFSWFFIAWGLAGVVAPATGGLLSRVGKKGWVSEDSLFASYPYLLPASVTSLVALIGFVSGAIFMKNTGQVESGSDSNFTEKYSKALEENGADDIEMLDGHNEYEIELSAIKKSSNNDSDNNSGDNNNHINGNIDRVEPDISTPSNTIKGVGIRQRFTTPEDSSDTSNRDYEIVPSQLSDSSISDGPVWRDKDVALAVSSYGLIALCWALVDELIPIYGRLVVKLSSNEMGIIFAMLGVMMIIMTVLLFPLLNRCIRTKKHMMLVMMTIAIVCCALFPLIEYFPGFWGPRIMFSIFAAVRIAVSVPAFSCVMSMVNNSAKLGKGGTLGRVNGLGQTLAGLVRAIGPFFAGTMWSLLYESKDVPIPLFLLFWIMAIIHIGTVGLLASLPPRLEKPRGSIQPIAGINDRRFRMLPSTSARKLVNSGSPDDSNIGFHEFSDEEYKEDDKTATDEKIIVGRSMSY